MRRLPRPGHLCARQPDLNHKPVHGLLLCRVPALTFCVERGIPRSCATLDSHWLLESVPNPRCSDDPITYPFRKMGEKVRAPSLTQQLLGPALRAADRSLAASAQSVAARALPRRSECGHALKRDGSASSARGFQRSEPRKLRDFRSQRLTTPLSSPAASVLPSGVIAREKMSAVCPVSTVDSFRSGQAHNDR
jgi:hypothetical protein